MLGRGSSLNINYICLAGDRVAYLIYTVHSLRLTGGSTHLNIYYVWQGRGSSRLISIHYVWQGVESFKHSLRLAGAGSLSIHLVWQGGQVV